MSKKDKEKDFKELWKEWLELNKDQKNMEDMEQEMIKITKDQLIRVINGIKTADDFRKYLVMSVRVLIKDYETLIMLLNEDKENNEN